MQFLMISNKIYLYSNAYYQNNYGNFNEQEIKSNYNRARRKANRSIKNAFVHDFYT